MANDEIIILREGFERLQALSIEHQRIILAHRSNEIWYAKKIIDIESDLDVAKAKVDIQQATIENLLETAKTYRAQINRLESGIPLADIAAVQQAAVTDLGEQLDAMYTAYHAEQKKAQESAKEAIKFKNKWEDQKGWVSFANSQREQTVEKFIALTKEFEKAQEDITELNSDYCDLYDESQKKIRKLRKKVKRLRNAASPRLKKPPPDRSWLKQEPENAKPKANKELSPGGFERWA